MVDMTTEEVDEWTRLIKKAASAVARDFFAHHIIEDIEMAAWEALMLAQSKGKLMTPHDDHASSVLYYAAKSAAWDERKERLMLSPNYAYRTKDVRKILRTFFYKTTWPDAFVPDDARSLRAGNDGLELSSDVACAWDRLDVDYRRLIFRAFACGEDMDLPTQKKLSHAVTRMADILNSYVPNASTHAVGSRRVVTNAHARHLVESEYSGDEEN